MADPVQPLEAALWYAAKLNWYIIPVYPPRRGGLCGCGVPNCSSPGKHPATKNGVHDADTDEGVIKDWARRYKGYNIGIATGEDSGLLVLDIDPRNGGDETLAELIAEHGPLPDVPQVRTGSGGRHFFFAYDGKRVGKLGVGIDVKGQGGFVVGAPSWHVSGNQYEWIRKPRAGEELPPAPEWITRRNVSSSTGHATDEKEPFIQGQRNTALAAMLGAMRRQGADHDTMLVAALRFNLRRFDPALDESEVRTVVNSISHYDMEPSTGPTPADHIFEFSDMGNGERMAAQHSRNMIYTQSLDWLVWDDQRWSRDTNNRIQEMAKQTVRTITREQDLTDDDDEKKEVRKHAKASQNATRIREMIHMASSTKGIARGAEIFDLDNWAMTVENGTLDLRTGELRPHNRADLITRLAPVTFEAAARAPRFKKFMSEIMGGNMALVGYMQRLLGYALTGDVSETLLPILYGFGGNGKTTLLNIVQGVMGKEYSGPAASGLLIAKKGESHPTEIADLTGKRLVIASETGSGKAMAIDIMKNLTGKDTLKARHMREDFYEFKPTHKIFLLTNYKPRVLDTDHAAWRRIRLIPFTVKFEGNTDEKHLDERLLAEEASGILNWMIEGCLEWQRNGMQTPDEVLAATNAYRSESDRLVDFIADYCYMAPEATVSRNALYKAYLQWTDSVGIKQRLQQASFTALLTPRPELGRKDTSVGGIKVVLWTGIGLKAALIELDNDNSNK